MKPIHFIIPLLLLFNSCKETSELSTEPNIKPEMEQHADAAEVKIEETEELTETQNKPQEATDDTTSPDKKKRISTGKIGLKILPKEQRDPDGLLRIRLRNDHSEALQSAKIWVIWFDSENKIIGQKSSWLPTKEDQVLKPEEERDFMVLVPVTSKPNHPKITFSKIVLEHIGTVSPERIIALY
ncbi:MAG: hypothetical protein ACSHX0_10430 [Akkermansiaceae bacterium]